MTTEKKVVDWERIELEYRAGVLSVREIASANGISHTAIQKRAKAQSWARDLSDKIKTKANSLVAKAAVAREVSTETAATEREVVEVNAQMRADIILSHRKDIPRYRNLVNSMLSELEIETENTELFSQLGELMASPDDKGYDKLSEIYRKVMALPSRADSLKKLIDTLKTLIALEREAFGIDAGVKDTGENGIRELLNFVNGSTAKLSVRE